MLRPSKFLTVPSTVFAGPNETELSPVFNSRTGRVYMVDKCLAQCLGNKDKCASQIPEEQVLQARELGLVVSISEQEELQEVIAENQAVAESQRTRTFVLMPSNYCNLGCSYCGQDHQRVALRSGHRSAVIHRVLNALEANGIDHLAIKWFGGEPLMGFGAILDISQRVISECETRGVEFSALIVTNGILLDRRKLDALYECRIRRIEITLDGLSHDQLRPQKSGRQDGLSRIVDFVAEAVACGRYPDLLFTIRTNVSPTNRGEAESFSAYVGERGLRHEQVVFYPAPIHSWGNDVTDQTVSKSRYGEIEMEWIRAYQKHGLSQSFLPRKRKYITCAATNLLSEVITAEGKVFSCTEQPLVPGYESESLGEVQDLLSSNRRPVGKYDQWNESIFSNPYPCSKCSILPICGGACPKAWEEGNPPCPASKYNMSEKLDLYAESLGYNRL